MAFRAIYIALLLALFGVYSASQAQSLQATLVVLPNPPKNLSDWRTSRDVIKLLVTNTKAPTTARVDAKLTFNGSIVAVTKREIPPITIPSGQTILYGSDLIPTEHIDFFGDLKQSAARTGIMPEGNYELCIQLYAGSEQIPVSNAECRSFSIVQYILPQLILPEHEKEYIAGTERLVTFRWSPLTPTPTVPVIYNLRAVQMIEGQTPQQAFASNPPLFEKKINSSLQTPWPAEIVIPQEGTTVVWGIRPEDARGAAFITPEGFTQPFVLKFLPLSPECAALSDKLKQQLKMLLAIEERYWQESDIVERAERLQEEAEDRGDAYETEHWQARLVLSSRTLETTKERYEAAYSAYEDALKAYKECTEKQ